ncbi:thioredoxin family protein [Metabacillus idriensis]|uniref:thioredoxin family protein n=1 Tax=Metabacillus idriensis TaxID=324768 RepID=UPI00174A6EF9|nr:thioredoxin family protein [Metabacillus idriensis]
MNKILIFSLIAIFLFASIAFIQIKTEKETKNNYNDLYKNQISITQLDSEIDSGNSTFVYFYQENCMYCKKVSPILIPLAKDLNIDLKVHDVQKYQESWDKYKIEGTPTLIHFNNNKEVDRINGANDKNIYEEWFELQKKISKKNPPKFGWILFENSSKKIIFLNFLKYTENSYINW